MTSSNIPDQHLPTSTSLLMLLQIPDLLTPDEVTQVCQIIDKAEWVDGKVTAGFQSARTKDNMQIPEEHPASQEAGNIILSVLSRSPLFMAAALPLKVYPPMFNSYSGGQHFGTHVDNSIRQVAGTSHRIRTDLSCTVFLTDPNDYEGGELCVEDNYGIHRVKLPIGHMVLYPATSLHYVEPVTNGARVSSFFWIQSLIRKDSQRTLLFDLDTSIQRLTQDAPDHPSTVQLTGIYHNLMREWAET